MRKMIPALGLIGLAAWLWSPGGETSPVYAVPRYKGGEVSGGGSIKGTVTISPVPQPAAFTVEKDVKTCRGTQEKKANFRLSANPETGAWADVVVYIDGISKGKALPKGQKFTIDQKECTYRPFITIAPKKSSVEITSSDPILHNVHVYEGTPQQPHSRTRDVLNQAMTSSAVPATPLERRDLRRPAFYYIRCDAGHIWMSAYIWVVEHPYYAKTDAKGQFELTDVPPGTYTLRFWHPGYEIEPVLTDGKVTEYNLGTPIEHRMTVTVEAGKATSANWQATGAK